MRLFFNGRSNDFFSAHSNVPIARNSITLNYSGESLWFDEIVKFKQNNKMQKKTEHNDIVER